jgi:hypothetical protein
LKKYYIGERKKNYNVPSVYQKRVKLTSNKLKKFYKTNLIIFKFRLFLETFASHQKMLQRQKLTVGNGQASLCPVLSYDICSSGFEDLSLFCLDGVPNLFLGALRTS